jgi:hypothetical protein
VHRIWRAFSLQPHRSETFKLKFNSFDGTCGRKMADFCGFRVAWIENWPEM